MAGLNAIEPTDQPTRGAWPLVCLMLICTTPYHVNGCQLPQAASWSTVVLNQWRFRLAHVDVYLNSGDSENAEFERSRSKKPDNLDKVPAIGWSNRTVLSNI